MEWIAFFFAVKHTEFDYLIETLLEYTVGGYIVAAETASNAHKDTGGEHFHFCCEMSNEDYHKFSKRVKIKYSLSGQARNGQARQYGKVDKINNIEKMKAYCLKDGNIRSNLEPEELDRLKEKSYKKEEKKKFEVELNDYLAKNDDLRVPLVRIDPTGTNGAYIDYAQCAIVFNKATRIILEYHILKEVRIPPPSLLKNYIKNYFLSLTMNEYFKSRILRRFMDIRNPFIDSSNRPW